MGVVGVGSVPTALEGIRPPLIIIGLQGLEYAVPLTARKKVAKILIAPADERVLFKAFFPGLQCTAVVLLRGLSVFQPAPAGL